MRLQKSVIRYVGIFLFQLFVLLFGLRDFRVINDSYLFRVIVVNLLFFGGYLLCEKSVKSIYCTSKKASVLFAILYAFVFCWGIITIRTTDVSFDTWQLYDMSRNVFSDFGKMDMLRQHIINTPYEMAFPPLFPCIMAVINLLFDFGVYSSVVVDLISFIMIVYILGELLRLHPKYKYPVCIIAVQVVLQPLCIELYSAGSTIPLGWLFFIATCYILMKYKDKITYGIIAIIALCCGLGVMNRFDYLPIAVIMGIGTVFIADKKHKLWSLVVFTIVFGVIISPWVMYSEVHFNKLFVTDNGRRLINIEDTRPSTFFSETAPALTIFDDFKAWLHASFFRWAHAAFSCVTVILNCTMIFQILIIFIGACFNKKLAKKGEKNNIALLRKIKCFIVKNRIGLVIVLSSMAQCGAIIMTGYPGDARYYILFAYVTFVVIMLAGQGVVEKLSLRNLIWQNILASIIAITLVVPSLCNISLKCLLCVGGRDDVVSNLILTEGKEAYEYLRVQEEPRIILSRDNCPVNLPRFAALSGMVTTMSPSNVDENNVVDFVEFSQCNFLYSADEEMNDLFEQTVGLEETEVEYLYKLNVK